MLKIGRPDRNDAPPWYPYFFNLASGENLIEVLEKNKENFLELVNSIPEELEDFKYAENKWTIKQVFIHLSDEERYYAYKAFCYSRRVNVDLEIPPSGGEYARHFNAAYRSLPEIAGEFVTVREATISLFSNMTNEMLDFKEFPDKTVNYTARSLGWMIAGHNIHHCKFVSENYLMHR